VAGAQDALPVGEQAPVLLLGVGVAALQLGRPGQGAAGGEGVGVVITQHAAPVG